MLEFKIDQVHPDLQLIDRAAEAVRGGAIVVLPTDTVYGMGASIFNEAAVARVFALKGRKSDKGLIAIIGDLEDLSRVCSQVPGPAGILMEKFWPGPLTIVMPAAPGVPESVTVKGTLGVRLPNNHLVRELVRSTGAPLALTSANPAGLASPVDAAQARDAVDGLADIFIDGGECSLGIESTVVDVRTWPPVILREGAISKESISKALRPPRPEEKQGE